VVSSSQLAAALPQASDVGSGWIVDSTGEPLPGSPKDWGPCASPLWGADITGTAAWLTYELNAGGDGAHGELGTTIFEAGSQGAADQQRAFLASPAAIDCEKSFVNSDTGERWPIANTPNVGAWAVAPDPVELRLPGDARLFALTQPTIDTSITIYYVLAHQYSGPYEASALVTWCSCEPVPAADVQSALSAIATRLSALPGAQAAASVPSTTTPVLPAGSLPTVIGVTKDTAAGFTQLNVVHVSWNAFARAKEWLIQKKTGSFSTEGAPPADVVDYATASGTVWYRAIACPDGCDTVHPPDPSVPEGANGPFIIGPWYSTTPTSQR
jgi:hypothetical protein